MASSFARSHKGFKFSTYAHWWIRQAITRALADQARTIRIPMHMIELINKLGRVSRRLLELLGREPSDEEIGGEMGITPERVREIIRFAQSPISLETPIGEEEDSHLSDFVQDREAVSPSDAASLTMLHSEVEDVLDTLTSRERRVIQLALGSTMVISARWRRWASDSRSPASVSVRSRSVPCTNSATPLARRNFAITWSSSPRQDARLKSSMPDFGQRLANNPILSSRDVAPSHPALEVVSVFNAAAATVGEETILLLRVGERPRAMTGPLPATARTLDPTAPEKGLQSLPTGMLGENAIGLAFLDLTAEPPRVVVAYVRKDLPGVDLSDPRTIRVRMPPAKPGGAEEVRDYLTQISHLRVARSTDGAHFEVDPLPAVCPVDSFEEYGCEDPRATLIDGVWHITYVSVGKLGITTSRLTTTDFRSFQRCGIMFLPDHKDVVLFPGRVGGRYIALTRPMPASFNRVLGIWIAFSDDMVSWGRHRPLALPRKGMWDALRTGAGAVPFRVPEGWIELYHGVNVDGQYAMGALLLDVEDPSRIIGRSPDPILVPKEDYELSGFYNNTVFSCGHVPLDDRGERIRMYYGSADSCMAGADFDVKEIVDSLIQC